MSRQPEGREIKKGHFMRGTRMFKARLLFSVGVISVAVVIVGVQLLLYNPEKDYLKKKILVHSKWSEDQEKRRDELALKIALHKQISEDLKKRV